MTVGCAAPPNIDSSFKSIQDPPIASEQTRELGDTLVRYTVAATRDSFRIVESATSPLYPSLPPPGYVLTPYKDTDEYTAYKEYTICRFKDPVKWCHGPC